MAFPRVTAVIFLILLIGSLSLLCIGATTLINPLIGAHVEHVEGKVVAIKSNMDFVLETAVGEHLYFHCSSSCREAVRHLQRHFYEQAATEVFYEKGPDRSLLALDID